MEGAGELQGLLLLDEEPQLRSLDCCCLLVVLLVVLAVFQNSCACQKRNDC